jgi:hypothetical protein
MISVQHGPNCFPSKVNKDHKESDGATMFVTVAAGDTLDNDYTLPADHPPGVYW